MSNVVDMNSSTRRVSYLPKHLDERIHIMYQRNADFETPLMFLVKVMNGMVNGATTLEDKIDAAKTLLPYFHSKAPVIEAEQIKELKRDVEETKRLHNEALTIAARRVGIVR